MMNLRLPSVLGLVLAVVVGSVGAARAAESSDTLVVSPSGPYTSIRAALEEAEEGMVIEVRGGEYSGSLIINKAVTLRGVDWPVIDGGGKGTVVTLSAPGSSIYGFEVRGSGSQPDGNDAGILMTASHTTAENNRLTDVLFGIFVAQADDAVVRGNHISSKLNYDLGRKGDGIRVWYSQRVTVEGNQLREVRDVVAWYSSEIILRDNLIEEGRYGIHLMYCDGAVIDGNRILNNSVGIYVMYSNDLALHENIVKGQRGPSGYALAFKDTNNVEASGNILADNRAGFFLDGTPFAPQTFARFEDNILAFNDIGVVMQPAVRGSQFTGNSFWENIEQVSIMGGGGTATQNSWEGNFWSDYTGEDDGSGGRTAGDGVGDTNLPHQTVDHHPLMKRACAGNTAPTIRSFSATSVTEGSPTSYDVDAIDDDGDPLTYSYDFQNDGAFDLTTTSSTASFTFFDDFHGPAKVRVSDGEETAEATTDVIVTNVIPVVMLAGPPSGSVYQVGTPVDFRGRILASLGRVDNPAVADVVLNQYATYEP